MRDHDDATKEAAGLRLVFSGKRGTLGGTRSRVLHGRDRGDAGALRVAPVIRAGDGEPAVPVAFIGPKDTARP